MNDQLLPAPLPVIHPGSVTLPPRFADLATRAWTVAREKVSSLVTQHPDSFPLYTEGGRWAFDGEPWTNWCEGFLGGQLWILANRTDDRWLRHQAERYSLLVERRKDDRTVHDLGFIFWPTWRRWFDATGDPAKAAVVTHAGRTLAGRFEENGRYIPSFLGPQSLFIDIMMNVGLIFYAAQQAGDSRLAQVAHEHCLTTRRVLVRGDGSVSHEGIFEAGSGRFLRQTTQQGWRDDGSWARGQSWALYGFGTAYRFTGDRRFLNTARACADFYMAQTGDSLIPPNDWAEPAPERRYESSAAAAASGGLWQLAGLVDDENLARTYADHAVRTLLRLCNEEFLAVADPAWEGILKHGVYHTGKDLGVDESTMWGDYWFLDTLDRISRHAGMA